MMETIQQILHPDPQQQMPGGKCPRCGGLVYAPSYFCGRCGREHL